MIRRWPFVDDALERPAAIVARGRSAVCTVVWLLALAGAFFVVWLTAATLGTVAAALGAGAGAAVNALRWAYLSGLVAGDQAGTTAGYNAGVRAGRRAADAAATVRGWSER